MQNNITSSNNHSGITKSIWMEVELPEFPPLDSNLDVDICIVGAGIAGLNTAYTLAKLGKSVAIIEQGVISGGQTSRTTGHLTWALDDRFYDLEKLFGEDGARLAALSHSSAIDYLEKIVNDEEIDCDFERVPAYLFSDKEDSFSILEKELVTIRKFSKKVLECPKAPFSSCDTKKCILFPDQAEFHILKYVKGLLKALLKLNVKIYSHTSVNDVQDGNPCVSKTKNGHTITSQSVVVSTCTPINDRFFIHTKQTAYRTYVIAASVPKDFIPKGLYWDTAKPYHYIRIQPNKDDPKSSWLIIGGEDHRTGQDPDIEARYDTLEMWAKSLFPTLKTFEYKWSGQIFEPVDSLAFIGRNPKDKNIYIVTGDSGNGLTHATIASLLIPDLILKRKNLFEYLYDPSRKTVAAAKDFIEENYLTLIQYKDWLTPGDIQNLKNLPKNQGFILRKGLKKIAVYKDIDGTIHSNSAFCPHLGACVHWNDGEKTWDCPCHGSRFDACGKVIDGPSMNDLYPLTNEA